MSIQENHIGPISTGALDGSWSVDVGSLVRRLLLFEHCTLETINLQEIPEMVRVFGYDGVKTLLKSGALSIVCDRLMAASARYPNNPVRRSNFSEGLLYGPINILTFGLGARGPYIDAALKSVERANQLTERQARNIQKIIHPKLGEYSLLQSRELLSPLFEKLNRPDAEIDTAVAMLVRDQFDHFPSQPIEVVLYQMETDGPLWVGTNLGTLLDIDDEKVCAIVERALVGVVSLNIRLGVMHRFNSVSGFKDEESNVLKARMGIVAARLMLPSFETNNLENQFERVVFIANLPSLENLPADQTIDVDQLLELRESPECKEMRSYIRKLKDETDVEISESFSSLREKVSAVTHSRGGKAVRFILKKGSTHLISAAAPGVGFVAGPAMSKLDNFVANELIGRPGPTTFLSRRYPTIFE